LEAQVANSTTKAGIILNAAVAISAVIAQHGDAYAATTGSLRRRTKLMPSPLPSGDTSGTWLSPGFVVVGRFS
jgi:hypothetical protein